MQPQQNISQYEEENFNLIIPIIVVIGIMMLLKPRREISEPNIRRSKKQR